MPSCKKRLQTLLLSGSYITYVRAEVGLGGVKTRTVAMAARLANPALALYFCVSVYSTVEGFEMLQPA